MPGAALMGNLADLVRSAWRGRALILLIAFLIAFGGLGAWSAYLYEAGVLILEKDSRRLAEEARKAIDEPKIDDAALLALEALPSPRPRFGLGRVWSPDAEAALADALGVGLGVRRMRPTQVTPSRRIAFPSDNRLLVFGLQPVVFDAQTGEESADGQPSLQFLKSTGSASSALISADQRHFAVRRADADDDEVGIEASESAPVTEGYCIFETETLAPVAYAEFTFPNDSYFFRALYAEADGNSGLLFAWPNENFVVGEWRRDDGAAACGGITPVSKPETPAKRTIIQIPDLPDGPDYNHAYAKNLSTLAIGGGQKAYFWSADAAPSAAATLPTTGQTPTPTPTLVSLESPASAESNEVRGAFTEIALGLGADEEIISTAVSDDGDLIAFGVSGGRIIFVSPPSAAPTGSLNLEEGTSLTGRFDAFAFGKSVATNRTLLFADMEARSESMTAVIDANTPALLRVLAHGRHARSVSKYAYDGASDQLAAAFSTGVVQVWEPFKTKLAHEVGLKKTRLLYAGTDVVWRPGGSALAMVHRSPMTGEGHVYVLNRDEFKPVRSHEHVLADLGKPDTSFVENYDLATLRDSDKPLFAVASYVTRGRRDMYSGVAIYDPETGAPEKLTVPEGGRVVFGRLAAAAGGALFAGTEEGGGGAVHAWRRGPDGQFAHVGKEEAKGAVLFLKASLSGRWVLAVDYLDNAILYDAQKIAPGVALEAAGVRVTLKPCGEQEDGAFTLAADYFVGEVNFSRDGHKPAVLALCRNGDVSVFSSTLALRKKFPAPNGDDAGVHKAGVALDVDRLLVLGGGSLREIDLGALKEEKLPHDFAKPQGVWIAGEQDIVAADGGLWARARREAHATQPTAGNAIADAAPPAALGADEAPEGATAAPASPEDAASPASEANPPRAEIADHPGWKRLWAPAAIESGEIEALAAADFASKCGEGPGRVLVAATKNALAVWEPADTPRTRDGAETADRMDPYSYPMPALGLFPIREPSGAAGSDTDDPPMRMIEFGGGSQLETNAARRLVALNTDADGNARLFAAALLRSGEVRFFEPLPFGCRLREIAAADVAAAQRRFTEAESERYGVKGHRDFLQWLDDRTGETLRGARDWLKQRWEAAADGLKKKPDATRHIEEGADGGGE